MDNMLTLYVLPPAFGLPSIDAQCLAAITYMKHAVPREQWELVSDVYATGNGGAGDWAHLPALWHGERQVHGYLQIVEYLSDISAGAWSLGDDKPGDEGAKAWLYANHVQSLINPLLSLLFYTSSENYSSSVRPAFGKALPFPTSWILPVNHHKQEMEKASATYPDVTSTQLSALADSLAEKPQASADDPLSTRIDPLTDEEILEFPNVGRIPREKSTSGVIDTFRKLQDLVAEALSIHQEAEEEDIFDNLGVQAPIDVYTCALYSHLGLAVAAAKEGMPHPWLTTTLQSRYKHLGRKTLRWLKDEWSWTPQASNNQEKQNEARPWSLSWGTDEPTLSEKTKALTAGVAQLSGVHRLQIPEALYTRSVRGFSGGYTLFAAREPRGRPLGHEVDGVWLGATGIAVATLAYKAWREGF